MKWAKAVWHDPVWSKVISVFIVWAASQAISHWPGISLTEIGKWYDKPITITTTRGDLINNALLVVLLVLSSAAILVGFRGKSREAAARAAAAEPRPSNPPQDALGSPEWNVLYAISQRRDAERVSMPTVLAVTGLTQLRAEVACDTLIRHNLIAAVGLDIRKEKLFGILPNGRIQALRISREQADGVAIPRGDHPSDLAPVSERLLRWVQLEHTCTDWTPLERVAAAIGATAEEVSVAAAGTASVDPFFELSKECIRLTELGKIVAGIGGLGDEIAHLADPPN